MAGSTLVVSLPVYGQAGSNSQLALTGRPMHFPIQVNRQKRRFRANCGLLGNYAAINSDIANSVCVISQWLIIQALAKLSALIPRIGCLKFRDFLLLCVRQNRFRIGFKQCLVSGLVKPQFAAPRQSHSCNRSPPLLIDGRTRNSTRLERLDLLF